MTNETSFREKGRAVFLAALMVLSVVAMSAAFVGGAAASDHYDTSFDVSDLDSEEIDVWTGQTVQVTGLESPADVMQNDESVVNLRVNDGSATFDTSELDDGRYYIEHGDEVETGTFWVNDHDVEVSFDGVANQEVVDLEYEDVSDVPRDSVDVVVSGEYEDDNETVDAETLGDIFGVEDDNLDDDEDTATVENVQIDDENLADISANFDGQDVGDYSFTVSVADTTAEDTVGVAVTDQDASYDFVDADSVETGEIANVTIDVEEANEAYISLSAEEAGDIYSNASIDVHEDGEIVLEYNTHAGNDVWSVHEDYEDNATVENDGDSITGPLPAHNWDMSLYSVTEDGVDREQDRDRLIVQERSEPGEVTTATAPQAAEVEGDFEAYDEATITETDTIAEGDAFIAVLEDYNTVGQIAEGDDLDVDINVTGEEDIFGNAEVWSTEDGTLTADLITDERAEYDGDLVYTLEADGDSEDFTAGDYDVTLTIGEDNQYIPDEDSEIEHEFEISFTERTGEWEAYESLPASSNATASGTTTVAPGTQLEANVDSPASEGGFVSFTDAVVNDDGTFDATFDLSDEEPGVLFDLTLEDTNLDEGDVLEDLELTEDGDEPEKKDLDVSVDAPSSIYDEESADFDITVTNNKDADITTDVVFEIGGEEFSDELDIDADSSGETSFTVEGADLGVGDHDYTATATSDDAEGEDSGTLTVEDSSAEDDDESNGNGDENGNGNGMTDDDDDDSDDDDDDGTPGFGVAVALVALLAAAMLALRRQD